MTREIIPAGEGWTGIVQPGQRFRITDLEGNQAADTLFFNADDPTERYCASQTITGDRRLYLGKGSTLRSNLGRAMGTITHDDCGRHDTVGGACACESNAVRYGEDRLAMHACRDSFLLALAKHGARTGRSYTSRDLAPNINFFMNVPVTPDGHLTFADGVSAPGKQVEVTALMPLLVLISNCPQLNNPCNGWNPTPIQVEIA